MRNNLVSAMRDEVSAIIQEKNFPGIVSRNELSFHVVRRIREKGDSPLNQVIQNTQSLNTLITEGTRNLSFPDDNIIYVDERPGKCHVGNRRFVRKSLSDTV